MSSFEWGFAGYALLVGMIGAVSVAARDFPKGLGISDVTEERLREMVGELSARFEGKEASDWNGWSENIAQARQEAETLAGQAADDDSRRPVRIVVPKKVPVVLAGTNDPEDVRRLWQEQLRMNIGAAHGLLEGDGHTIREWVGWPLTRESRNRAEPLAESLREAEKLVALLAADTETVRLRKEKTIFADDFSDGDRHWMAFGQCLTWNEQDAFRMKDEHVRHPDAMMWTREDFDGDFLVEFLFTPHSQGGNAGALFAICGRPRPGLDWSVSAGSSMDTYNRGIDAYHFSMHRGTTGLGNVRRVGPGLKMLASGKDPCPVPGREYRVEIGKFGPTIFLVVDGKLAHSWFDAGSFGPMLESGRIGIRHWAGMDAGYRQFRVYRLAKDTKS